MLPDRDSRRASLGIDAGSTTAKLAVVSGDGALLWSRISRHRGRARELVDSLLAEMPCEFNGLPRAFCGSLGAGLAGDEPWVHEVQALTLALALRHPDARTAVDIGGQDAKLVRPSPADMDVQMNDRCAAGTGATLDRIARRLGLDEQEMRNARDDGSVCVASRCGVFAENDVVGLVKQGVPRALAFAACAPALVRQIRGLLARGRPIEVPLVLLGGPHVHLPSLVAAWRDALAAEGAASRDVFVPRDAELYPAIGAALFAARSTPGRASAFPKTSVAPPRRLPPLPSSPRVAVVPVMRSSRALDLRGDSRPVYLGIDAGSTTTKAVLLDEHGALVAASYAASIGNPVTDAQARIEALGEPLARARALVAGAATGYGAPLVARAFELVAEPLEIDAHATAAQLLVPSVDTVIDLGGTDVKLLRLSAGRVVDVQLSSQCSAGYGAFLQSTAAELGIPQEEIGARALAARSAPRFGIGCAVFMDTDRVSFQREGATPEELLAGLAWAVAESVFDHVASRGLRTLGRVFLISGGVARNRAVVAALAAKIHELVPDAHVAVPESPELLGAMGAARIASRQAPAALSGRAQVRLAAHEVSTPVRNAATRCDGCELACERTLVSLKTAPGRDQVFVLGHACERGSAPPGTVARRTSAHAPDLIEEEHTKLFLPVLPCPTRPRPRPRATPRFGVPRTMGLYRCAPLVLHYLRARGVGPEELVLGGPTSPALLGRAEAFCAADPCFPAKAAWANVRALLLQRPQRPFDVLLMPAVERAAIDVVGVADTASCPIVAAGAYTAAAAARDQVDDVAMLRPRLDLSNVARLGEQLFHAFADSLGASREEHELAFAFALRAQRAFRERLQRRGRHVLAQARKRGRPVAVLLARPYHVDPGVQHGVSTTLASRGVAVLGISSLPRDDAHLLDLSTLLPEVTNSGSAERVWAARVVASDPLLHAVELSSFRCGQDASTAHVIDGLLDAARKPRLRLHDLDEDRPNASLSLRIGAFLSALEQARTLTPVSA